MADKIFKSIFYLMVGWIFGAVVFLLADRAWGASTFVNERVPAMEHVDTQMFQFGQACAAFDGNFLHDEDTIAILWEGPVPNNPGGYAYLTLFIEKNMFIGFLTHERSPGVICMIERGFIDTALEGN